ncbi:MAG: thiamine phosphate synthase [Actinomycetota bacterium]|nr:thiamine phosphate synthase [Actinomycetota bacterium]
MNDGVKNIDLYFITDSRLTKKTVTKDVESALKAGLKIIQYREKGKSTRGMIEEAKEIKKLCRESGALLIINDRVDIALAVDADGVHLGNEDMPYKTAREILGSGRIIGLTVHNIKEAKKAEGVGADYIGVSPVYETRTKPDAGMPAGIRFVREVNDKIKIPAVAIGGINENNIEEVLKAGAKSAAIISAIVTFPDVEKKCRYFKDIILKYRR